MWSNRDVDMTSERLGGKAALRRANEIPTAPCLLGPKAGMADIDPGPCSIGRRCAGSEMARTRRAGRQAAEVAFRPAPRCSEYNIIPQCHTLSCQAEKGVPELGMSDHPYRFEVGPYWLTPPGHAVVAANIRGPAPSAYQVASTNWTVRLGRFQFFLHLDALHDPSYLKTLIDWQTKGDVALTSVSINGVTYGGYGPNRTWIDWWLKKGDTMLCDCLQSVEFPRTEPNAEERAEHAAIIASPQYSPDFPTEPAPPPGRPLSAIFGRSGTGRGVSGIGTKRRFDSTASSEPWGLVRAKKCVPCTAT